MMGLPCRAALALINAGFTTSEAADVLHLPDTTVAYWRRHYAAEVLADASRDDARRRRYAERDAAIVADLEAGADSWRIIARRHGVARDTVRDLADLHGIPRRRERRPHTAKPRLHDAEIVALYLAGKGLRSAGAPFGVSHHIVKTALQAAGVPIRKHRYDGPQPVEAPRVARPRQPRHLAEQAKVPTTWRCACGARVTNATTCPQGHAAPWAEAA